MLKEIPRKYWFLWLVIFQSDGSFTVKLDIETFAGELLRTSYLWNDLDETSKKRENPPKGWLWRF